MPQVVHTMLEARQYGAMCGSTALRPGKGRGALSLLSSRAALSGLGSHPDRAERGADALADERADRPREVHLVLEEGV